LVVRIIGQKFAEKPSWTADCHGGKRQAAENANEIALTILLVALTLVSFLVTRTLLPFSLYSVETAKAGQPISITVLVALLVASYPHDWWPCCQPCVAGIGRMMQKKRRRHLRARGGDRRRRDVLLLDKTGTIIPRHAGIQH